jgi:YVTN family beta-propeller protein
MVRVDAAGHSGNADALDLRILGPLEAWRGPERLNLGGRRQRSVLVCLLLDPDQDVSTARIVEAVWGNRPPTGVLTTLQGYVFHLRQALEPPRAKGAPPSVILTVPGGYRLQTAGIAVDAVRFEQLVARGRSQLASDPAAASAQLAEALALWRGDALTDVVSLNGFAAPVATRLDERHAAASELWVEAELALGRPVAIEMLDALVARYPLREHLAALRMLALYRAGRQAEALDAYRRLRRTLDDELGIRPSTEVETLHQQMLRQDPALDAVAARAEPIPAADTVGPDPAVEPDAVRSAPGAPVSPIARRQGFLRRLKRRRWGAATAVALVAVAVLAGWVWFGRRADVTPLPANSLGPINVQGLDGDAAILDGAPSAMVFASGAIWAAEGDSDAVVRIDQDDRRVTQTVRDVGRSPQALAALGEDLWVVASREKVVTRVDMTTAQAGHKIPVGTDPVAVAAGPGGVWVANSGDGTVVRIDPATEQRDAPIFVGDGPNALALDGSTLWVANGRSGTVSQIDTRTGDRTAADIRVDAGPAALAVTETDVWVANEGGQSVSRIIRSTGRVQQIDVGEGPSSVVVKDDQVWVTNRYSGTIARIDVGTNAVETTDVRSAVSVLAAVGGELWAGAGGLPAAEHRGGTLVWEGSETTLQATVDPGSAYFTANQYLLRSAYDSLAAFRLSSGRSQWGLVPDLATELLEPTDGGRTYVFTIRPGIRYSTGAVVKASDFVRGVQRALQPTASNPALLRAIVGASECLDLGSPGKACDLGRGVVADDTTGRLTIRLTEPDSELLEKLALLLFPAPDGTPMGDQTWTPIPGTGPYVVTSAGPDGVTLSRNPYFRQWSAAARPDGYPDVITWRRVASNAQAVEDVLSGSAAVAFPQEFPLPISLTSRPAYIRQFELLDIQGIFPNPTVPPFDDRRVRQALNYAVDRTEIRRLEGVQSDYATATCQLIPPGIPGHRPFCPYQTGPAEGPYQGPDLAKARALVTESGTTGIPIVMYTGPRHEIKARAEYTATVLRDLGYQVTVAPVAGDAPRSVTDAYQIQSRLGWLPDYPQPGTYFDAAVGCGAAYYVPYCNPTIQALADRARSLRRTDPAQSLALWAQVDHMLTDDAAFVPMITRVATVVVNPQVGNVINRDGFGPLLDQMWLR